MEPVGLQLFSFKERLEISNGLFPLSQIALVLTHEVDHLFGYLQTARQPKSFALLIQ
ncbi:hypothetical protein M878_31510 [Streptomyces roseochromogenus subsp. oscitans DS 12.976]|uniref:Uncharacterized protein n=1 Tax=Streptomyces roseochromogenus subsp. oscitans DS 12.976 TaxID=1352936 RepID=V6JWD6_STRRC|nr:hypothetical protein M878_31510 [Streptomyces roseochromogenus subsp. oscitans DS 12.976]